MKHTTTTRLLLPAIAVLFALTNSSALAQDKEKPRERESKERRESREKGEPRHPELHPEISPEEIEEYINLARELGEELERFARRNLGDLAEDIRRRLAEGSEGDRDRPSSPREEEIAHLREAAEHLARAGREDEARKLQHQAEMMARELHHPHHPGVDQEIGRLQRRIDELEETVRRLEEEHRDLRELLNERPL